MSRYSELDAQIRLLAKDNHETINFYKQLVAQYFEGDLALDDLPESLKIVVFDWEAEQILAD